MQPAPGLIYPPRCQYLTRPIAAAARSSDYGALIRLDEFAANETVLWRDDLAHLPHRPLHRHLRRPGIILENNASSHASTARLRARPLGRRHPAAAPSPRA